MNINPVSRNFSFRINQFHNNPTLLSKWANWSGWGIEAARAIFGTGEIVDRNTAAVILGVDQLRVAKYVQNGKRKRKVETGCELNSVLVHPKFKFERKKRPVMMPRNKWKRFVLIDDLFMSMLERRMMKPYDNYERHF